MRTRSVTILFSEVLSFTSRKQVEKLEYILNPYACDSSRIKRSPILKARLNTDDRDWLELHSFDKFKVEKYYNIPLYLTAMHYSHRDSCIKLCVCIKHFRELYWLIILSRFQQLLNKFKIIVNKILSYFSREIGFEKTRNLLFVKYRQSSFDQRFVVIYRLSEYRVWS